jgi:hypothetical protein
VTFMNGWRLYTVSYCGALTSVVLAVLSPLVGGARAFSSSRSSVSMKRRSSARNSSVTYKRLAADSHLRQAAEHRHAHERSSACRGASLGAVAEVQEHGVGRGVNPNAVRGDGLGHALLEHI